MTSCSKGPFFSIPLIFLKLQSDKNGSTSLWTICLERFSSSAAWSININTPPGLCNTRMYNIWEDNVTALLENSVNLLQSGCGIRNRAKNECVNAIMAKQMRKKTTEKTVTMRTMTFFFLSDSVDNESLVRMLFRLASWLSRVVVLASSPWRSMSVELWRSP